MAAAKNYERILLVPDLHLPAEHPQAFDFIRDLQDQWQTTSTIFLGDMYDMACAGVHEKLPGAKSAKDEYEEALGLAEKWYDHFSTGPVHYLVGNHCARVHRQAESIGLCDEWVKPIKELYKMPKNWQVTERFGMLEVPGVDAVFQHGDKTSPGGRFPAISAAQQMGRSVFQGHFHSAFGCQWYTTPFMRVFGCQVGSLCDPNHIAQSYGRAFRKRPVLGAALCIHGQPVCEPLLLDNKLGIVA